MTTRAFKDADGNIFYVEGTGTGDIGTPFKPYHILNDSAGSAITNTTGSADATSATSNRVPVVSHVKGYNGTTWDLIRAGLTAITSTFTGFVNGLFFGMYNSGGITLTTGQGAPLQLTSSGRVLTDSSGVTQPVSAASLPLPSGAATSAAQTTTNSSLSSIDGKVTACNTGAVTVSSSALPSGAATAANQTNAPVISNSIPIAGVSFARPGDTNAYASGDLVANNTASGSVTPIQFTVARANDKPFTVLRAGLTKSTTGTTNAQFKLHLYNSLPTVTNGDNGAFSSIKAGYLGSFDLDMSLSAIFSDGAVAKGAPSVGSSIIAVPATGTQLIYGLLEARGAYSPGNAETFVASLEVIQD